MKRTNGKRGSIPADKHRLYQWSVQTADVEVAFMERVFRRHNRARPVLLREDFCGGALVCAEWVRGHPERHAIGLDIHAPTLNWALRENLAGLREGRDGRVELLRQDVRSITEPSPDICCALNFSYMVFKPLRVLIQYFRFVRESLAPGGLFVLDCYGGWEGQQVKREPRRVDSPFGRFTYIWDQHAYNPVDNSTVCHIHFELPGGRKLRRAFTYRWRLYTPAEVCDALDLAGFRDAEVYWDVAEETDESDYRLRKRGENHPGWYAYVVGVV